MKNMVYSYVVMRTVHFIGLLLLITKENLYCLMFVEFTPIFLLKSYFSIKVCQF